MIDIAAIVLPHPDSPTIPSVSPASTSKLRPSTAWTVAAAKPDLGLEVFHLEESRHAVYLSWRRTSKASCRASPMKLNATTVITIMISAG